MWHRHFIPSLIAGLAVAVMAYLQEQTVSNIVLISSIGTSAMILTNATSHHLTTLRTAIEAYVVGAIIALLVQAYVSTYTLATPLLVSITVFFVGMAIYLLTQCIRQPFLPPSHLP